MSRLTDSELMVSGSREGFAEVYERYGADIHRFVTRRLGADLADDVTAETFAIAWRQRDRYDLGRHQARPWLYGIATRVIGRHRRAEIRGLRALARTGRDPVALSWQSETEVEARLDAARHSRALAGALASLHRRDRDVLLLVAWADLGYHEVAKTLDIPVGTVRSRLHRARSKVRDALTTPISEASRSRAIADPPTATREGAPHG